MNYPGIENMKFMAYGRFSQSTENIYISSIWETEYYKAWPEAVTHYCNKNFNQADDFIYSILNI